MSSYQWIKLYDEILDDPKMGRLSDGAYRFCINIFLMAGRQDLRDGSLPDFDDLAWHLRLSNDDITKYWGELERAEIVSMVDGNPHVNNFDKRQAAVTDAERMKQYRARKKKAELEKLPENDTTSDTKEPHERYAPVTERNTDIDKDIDKDIDLEKDENIYTYPHLSKIEDEILTALTENVKTRYYANTQREFLDAVHELIGGDVTPEDIRKAAELWEVHCWYDIPSKMALKTALETISQYKRGVWPPKPKPAANNTGPSRADKIHQMVTAAAQAAAGGAQ